MSTEADKREFFRAYKKLVLLHNVYIGSSGNRDRPSLIPFDRGNDEEFKQMQRTIIDISQNQ